MEETKTLRDLAINASTEIPTDKEVEEHYSENPPIHAHVETKEIDGVSVVLGKIPPRENPQLIANKENHSMKMNEGAEELMRHTQTPPAPSMAGLTPEMINQLNSPVANDMNNVPNLSNDLRPEQLEMLRELTPEMPEEVRIERGVPMLKEFEKIMKDLIVNFGLTPEEAKTGAMNRVKNNIKKDYQEYMNENPVVGVVNIDKTTDVNDLALTADEHKKLEKVKKIRLIMVEDADLANVTIERPAEEHKAEYIKALDGSVAKYSVPLPMYGDFVSFKGAQIIQMANIINYDDARIDEIINNKASLIYDKLVGGSVLKKMNGATKEKISYNEFINRFAYQDLDIALYAIVCASAMEESSTSLTCESCDHVWDHRYNIKSLLQLDSLPDQYKQRVDDILANKSNEIALQKIHNDRRKARRYKSPFTNNIYDMSYPTVARAINILKRIDQKDSVMNYISALALYLSRILLYDPSKNTYIEVSAEETDLLLDTMQTLTNDDSNMIANQIREEFFYSPSFMMKVTCPSCHKSSEIPLNIENLIFLMAQDSMVEIEG